jgi:hypothetical protein
MPEVKRVCFIIMPITTPEHLVQKYSDGRHHFRHVLEALFIPSVKLTGLEPRPPIAKGSDIIPAEIIRNLETSDLVLCDISTFNPNVFYELGCRTALNKPVCYVKDELVKRIPFDTGIVNHYTYNSDLKGYDIDDQREKLALHIQTSLEDCYGVNPLWKYFGLSTSAKISESPSQQAQVLTPGLAGHCLDSVGKELEEMCGLLATARRRQKSHVLLERLHQLEEDIHDLMRGIYLPSQRKRLKTLSEDLNNLLRAASD